MTESRHAGSLLKIATAARARVHLPAADHPRDLRVQPEPGPGLAADGLHAHWFGEARQPGGHRGRRELGHRRDLATAIALVLGTLASSPSTATVLRSPDDLVPARPADRAPGRRDRRRAAHVVRHARRRLRTVHDHRRPRHVLRGHRLQQRDRPAPAPAPIARGGLGRPRRGHVHDVPAHHAAGDENGAAVGRRCWRSRCRSTRSSSRTSPRAPAPRRCPCTS